MNVIRKKKPFFKISDDLRHYLITYRRECDLPVCYDDLLGWRDSIPVKDSNKQDTLWEFCIYDQSTSEEINRALVRIYSLLKMDGDSSAMEHLSVDRIDYCTFGNSKPFRIKIKNKFNDNHDYYYIKKTDASRIYGLELEHSLSPNRINYLVNSDTLIEEHIIGVPGDQYINYNLKNDQINEVRLAKEFIKFNERCFVRLLGDMRSYNYVVAVTPDFDFAQYRIRAIDFDQQSYEGDKKIYMPQFFEENSPVVNFVKNTMNPETILQYQYEERTLIARRYYSSRVKTEKLLNCMCHDRISNEEKIVNLREELAIHHGLDAFLSCDNMGEILKMHMLALISHRG